MPVSSQDPERFFTAAERRSLSKRKAASRAEAQRNLEDDFWWEPIDLGGEEW